MMKIMEYTGKIQELQGKIATIEDADPDMVVAFSVIKFTVVKALFKDPVMFNGRRLDTQWTLFTPEQFSPIGSKPIF